MSGIAGVLSSQHHELLPEILKNIKHLGNSAAMKWEARNASLGARVDRSAAAHSTGFAVPFLAPDVVQYALAIPARWKIRGPQGMEKWPLRQGLANSLSEDVIWRGKSKFWEGSGSGASLSKMGETSISDQEFESERYIENGDQIRSKEELVYYRIFKEHFGDSIPR